MLGKWFTLGSGFVFTPSPSSAVSFSPKLLWFQPFLLCAWTGSAAPAACWGSGLCLWVWKSWYSKYWGPEEEAGMSLAPFGCLVNFWTSICSVSYDLLSGFRDLAVYECVWTFLASAGVVLLQVPVAAPPISLLLLVQGSALTSCGLIFIFHQIPPHSHTTGINSD